MTMMTPIDPTNDTQKDRLSWGVVEFEVTDLARAVAFWKETLGLVDRQHGAPGVALGTSEKTLFVFHGGASRAVARAHTGMYHVAVGVRTQAEFSRMLARLIHLNVQVSPTDHLMAKSLYFTDPDGLEIEITYETPERFGHFGDMSKGLTLYDTNGAPHSGRGPLDVNVELAHPYELDRMDPLDGEAYLAHLHFKVAGLEPSLKWYEGLGFSRHLTLDSWGFADMGAGKPNTHRLAMNIWSGPNQPPAPDDMARLVHYELVAEDAEIMTQLQGFEPFDNGMRGTDPAGVAVTIFPAKTV